MTAGIRLADLPPDVRKAVRVTLPLPPKECNPNARCHWAKKARAVREYRSRTWAEVVCRYTVSERPGWERAEGRAVFYWPDRRRRDMDNAAASIKAAWDGIADAGVVANDSGLIPLPPVFRVDRGFPRVEIEVRPA